MVAGKMVGLTSDLHGRATYAKLIASERGRGVRRRVGTSEGVGSGGVRVSGGVGWREGGVWESGSCREEACG